MRNAITMIAKALFFVVVGSAMAQSGKEARRPIAAGPAYDLSVGYTFVRMAMPPASSVNLNGLDVSGNVDFNSRWGVMVDADGALATGVFGTTHKAYLLSLNGGPVFYPLERRNTRFFVRALAGVGQVGGATPLSDTGYFHGRVVHPSYALGGGIERAIEGPFAIRVSGDYLRTSFYDYTGTIKPQNSVRVTASFVFHLSGHQPR